MTMTASVQLKTNLCWWVSRGLAPRRTDWRQTARRKVTLTLTLILRFWGRWGETPCCLVHSYQRSRENVQLWRWSYHVPPNRWCVPRVHGVASQTAMLKRNSFRLTRTFSAHSRVCIIWLSAVDADKATLDWGSRNKEHCCWLRILLPAENKEDSVSWSWLLLLYSPSAIAT
jgi:hypothetical protein